VFGEKMIGSVEAYRLLWLLFDGEGRTIEEKYGCGGGGGCVAFFEIKKNIKFILRWKQKKNKEKKCCGKEAIYEEQKTKKG